MSKVVMVASIRGSKRIPMMMSFEKLKPRRPSSFLMILKLTQAHSYSSHSSTLRSSRLLVDLRRNSNWACLCLCDTAWRLVSSCVIQSPYTNYELPATTVATVCSGTEHLTLVSYISTSISPECNPVLACLSLFALKLDFATPITLFSLTMVVINQTTTNDDSTTIPRRLLLVSVPRTASNLLLKVLNIHYQPNHLTSPKGGYFFYPAFMSAAQNGQLVKPSEKWTEDEKQTVQTALQACFDNLEEYSTQAQQEGKTMFAKEHAFWFYSPASFQKMTTSRDDVDFSKAFRVNIPVEYGLAQTYSPLNETILSDEYLRSWQFAFLIRHPALAWPSMYRTLVKIAAVGFMDEDGVTGSSLTNMSLRWTRMLYDWCMQQPNTQTAPVVIDAHDFIHNPEIVLKFCELTGLDKSVLQFEWESREAEKNSNPGASASLDASTGEQDLHGRAASIMLSSLEGSSGVLREKAPVDLDIVAEVAKWKVEFGDEVAQLIEKAVWDAMPDYEYLRARRIALGYVSETV